MLSSKIALAAATLGAMTVWACASAPAQPAQAAQAAQSAAAPATAPAPAPAPAAAAPGSRSSSGEELVNTVCTQCHTLDNLKVSPHKADEWPDVIDKMVQFGLEISADDRKTVEAYLASHYSATN